MTEARITLAALDAELEELRQRVARLEDQRAALAGTRPMRVLDVGGVRLTWEVEAGRATALGLPCASMFLDSTLASLLSSVVAMVGPERFSLAMQADGRRSGAADWAVITSRPTFAEGFQALSRVAAAAGWGTLHLLSLDLEGQRARFASRDGWEGRVQRGLGVCWGSGLLAGKLAGYAGRLFGTNCWATQVRFIARGDDQDEFEVAPSPRNLELELEALLATDQGTRADMALALERLRQSQDELKQARRDLEALIDNLPALIAYWDAELHNRFANRAYLEWFGKTPLQIAGELLPDVIGQALWQKNRPFVEAVLNGVPQHFERELVRADGLRRHCNMDYIPDVSDGRVQGFYVLVTDISAIKKAELAAEEANHAKSSFLATMSHELRTPLNGIIGLAQLLTEPGALQPRQLEEFPRTIFQSGQALLAILNDILDLAKIEAGKYELAPAPFEPGRLLGEVASVFREAAGMRGLELKAWWRGVEGATFQGDVNRLRQMLSNLVGNAVKFTVFGSIELSAEPEGAGLRFSVVDTGPGLAPDQQTRLFRPFSQLDASSTRQFGGTGLGLSIVKQLATLMGGTAGVSSTPGEGSRFWFTVQAAPAQLQGRGDRPLPGLASPRGLKVLVVEDMAVNALVVTSMLQRLGCTSERLGDGEEAVAAVRAGEHWDVVLMDLHMPRMDGLAATRAIRSLEQARAARPMPIIALTASAYASDIAVCREAGMDELLSKPVRLEQLAEVLGRHGRAG
jgi:PAS domain S-box-containing protein